MDKYFAGTQEEITSSLRKFPSRFHLKYLLHHSGIFRIVKKGIELDGWRTISWDMLTEVNLESDNVLSAKMFATQSRLFFAKSAKPIKLIFKNGEIVYLYVNWKFWTGLSSNSQIYTQIKKKIY